MEKLVKIQKPFEEGLNVNYRLNSINQCENTVPKDGKMYFHGLNATPYNLPQEPTFPYPQYFKTSEVELLLYQDKIYSIPDSSWLTFYDAETGTSQVNITPASSWTTVDLGKHFILSNNYCTIFTSGLFPGKYLLTTAAPISACCYHKGRVLLARLATVSSDLWQLESTRYIIWSKIGGGDIYNLLLGLSYGAEEESQVVNRGDSGYIFLPTEEEIIALVPCGDFVLALSEYQTFRLHSYAKPIPTYGLASTDYFGLKNKLAVKEVNSTIYYLTHKGNLAIVNDREMHVKEIAWRIGEENCIILSSNNGRYIYISSETESYILAKGGLGRLNYGMTAILRDGYVIPATTDAENGSFSITLGPLNFDSNSRKAIKSISVQGNIVGKSITVSVKKENGVGFLDLPTLLTGSSQIYYLSAEAREFMIKIEGFAIENTFVESIILSMAQYDFSNIRGEY